MTSDVVWPQPVGLLSVVVATAVAHLHATITDYTTHMGRSGIMVSLRNQAQQLAESGIGSDQVTSCAFYSAADDIAWGRPPLATWRIFAPEAIMISDRDRVQVRAGVPSPKALADAPGDEIAREIERRALAAPDAFDAIRGLSSMMSAAAGIQRLLWDDPRIAATPDLRAAMRASIAPLQRRADALVRDARLPFIPAHPIARPISAWRKIFAPR